MDLKGLYDLATAVETDITSGQFAQATIDGGKLLQALGEAAQDVGFKAGPDDEDLCVKIGNKLHACHSAACSPPKSANETQKIGDGTILKNLTTLFLTIWPLIAPFLKQN